MQQPQNQRQMADSRQQLEQTRSDLQRASEALEAGQASRALTAGTRAQQRLEEMKEEFRRRSAGSFDEAVRDLQQDARELADRLMEFLLGEKMGPAQVLQKRRSIHGTPGGSSSGSPAGRIRGC